MSPRTRVHRSLPTLVGAVLLTAAAPLYAGPPAVAYVVATNLGGWAVVTVEDLPDFVVAGQPVSLTFRVRQHGKSLLSGLKARLEARAGRLTARAVAIPGNETGQYTATLTLPQAGEWTITIRSGFMEGSVTLLPLEAVDAGNRSSVSLREDERGRRLFVAKGCVTCHTDIAVGPNLTGRRYPAEYLTQLLANPAATRAPGKDEFQMPDLSLKQREIAALVAFINTNTDRQAALR